MSEPIKCTIPRVSGNVNYGLRVTMMCQCGFIIYNKYHFDGDAVNGEGSAGVGTKGRWELSVPPTWFCCKPKICLKNRLLNEYIEPHI